MCVRPSAASGPAGGHESRHPKPAADCGDPLDQAVLATFVAINTMMYLSLAVAKILPKIYPTDYLHGGNRRRESRSIHPNARR